MMYIDDGPRSLHKHPLLNVANGQQQHFQLIVSPYHASILQLINLLKGNSMLDEKTIKVCCPKCGTQINETVGLFKKPGKSCPGCGLQFTTERFRRAIQEAEKLL